MCACVSVGVCVCVCLSVSARVCVCVCVCVRLSCQCGITSMAHRSKRSGLMCSRVKCVWAERAAVLTGRHMEHQLMISAGDASMNIFIQ